MKLDIKTTALEQRRQTYANVARRKGADMPASRYEEATLDLQPAANFHYRPTWDSSHLLFDAGRTAIVMDDWYAIRDPRQFYYGTYTIARSRMTETQEKNFAFVEKRNLLSAMDPAWTETVKTYLLPLKHYEWGANMNNCQIADLGSGAAITQIATFNMADRLGIAQFISRIALLLDGNSGAALEASKKAWLEDGKWQEMRHMVEDSFVLDDWFEQFVAQNFCMDGIVYPLVYQQFDAEGDANHGAGALAMLSEFMVDWYAEGLRVNDAVLKLVAGQSEANRAKLAEWIATWSGRAAGAFQPIAEFVLGENAGRAAIAAAGAELAARAQKAGI